MKKAFILIVPSLEKSSLVEGALIIARALSNYSNCAVRLISLRSCRCAYDLNGISVDQLSGGYFKKIKYIQSKYLRVGIDQKVIVSFGLPADLVTICLKGEFIRISSVRCEPTFHYPDRFGPFRGKLIAIVHYAILRRFDKTWVVSNALQEHLRSKGICRSELIGSAAVGENLLQIRNNIWMREKTRIDGRKLAVGFFGRLSRPKGFHVFLELVSRAPFLQTGNSSLAQALEFIVIGDGPMAEQLNSKNTPDHVVIHTFGNLENPINSFTLIDVFIFPSKIEGMSRALLECMGNGKPCIVDSRCANSELIDDGVNGFLFDSIEQLANILTSIVLDGFPSGMKVELPYIYTLEGHKNRLLECIDRIN